MPKNFSRFPETRKIRTISFDTNIISDIMYYYILERKNKLSKKKKEYLERLSDSMESVILSLSVKIKTVGIDVIRKELKYRSLLPKLYKIIFENQVNVNREIKWLAKSYLDKINIESPDALIMASASVGKIDLFLSWNRDDIVKDSNLKIIEKLNKKRRVPFPVFATPSEFLDRIFLSNRMTICLSQLPMPRRFHLKTFQTK